MSMSEQQQFVMQQFLVSILELGTRCINFDAAPVLCRDLKARVYEIARIPAEYQRIATGCRDIRDDELIRGDAATYTVLVRVRGGKGGFGSLLRTSKSKKKITNHDSCRDLSGRRIRHVNAEKIIKEWQEDEGMRQMEKVALDYLKKKVVDQKKTTNQVDVLNKFREQAERNSVEVQMAIMAGLKRKKKTENQSKKKLKLIVVEDESDLDEEPTESDKVTNSAVQAETPQAEVINPAIEAEVAQTEFTMAQVEPVQLAEGEVTIAHVEPVQLAEPAQVLEEAQAVEPPTYVAQVQPVMEQSEVAELNFEDYSSAHDLEALGLERLKMELQKRGLKCGGSLSERAKRLFLLKSTPRDKLDKKYFAKA